MMPVRVMVPVTARPLGGCQSVGLLKFDHDENHRETEPVPIYRLS